MKIIEIYKATNKENGLIYIGKTKKGLKERNRLRQWDATLFGEVFRSIGEDGFRWEILDETISEKEASKLESYWIEKLNTTDRRFGYNLIGGSDNAYKTQETKVKISVKQKGEKNHMYGNSYYKNGASKRVVDISTGIVYESGTQARDLLFYNLVDKDYSTIISKSCRGLFLKYDKYNRFRFMDKNGNIKYFEGDTEIDKDILVTPDGSLDINFKIHNTYLINILTKEKLSVPELGKKYSVDKNKIYGMARRNRDKILKNELPYIKLRDCWVREDVFSYFNENLEKFDFNKTITHNCFIYFENEDAEFSDAHSLEEYFKTKGIKIRYTQILSHLKHKSKFRNFPEIKLKYIY